jgi:hypothetical protein
MRSWLMICLMTIALATFITVNMRDEPKVYACSDPDIPPDVKKRCPKPTPRWENGCIIREVHGREFKACG